MDACYGHCDDYVLRTPIPIPGPLVRLNTLLYVRTLLLYMDTYGLHNVLFVSICNGHTDVIKEWRSLCECHDMVTVIVAFLVHRFIPPALSSGQTFQPSLMLLPIGKYMLMT